MVQVGVHEAKTHLSRLLRQVAAGDEVVITRAGAPVAKLVPVEQPVTRRLGIDARRFELPEDFDRPLDETRQSLPAIADWGPAQDWSDRADAER